MTSTGQTLTTFKQDRKPVTTASDEAGRGEVANAFRSVARTSPVQEIVQAVPYLEVAQTSVGGHARILSPVAKRLQKTV